MTERYDPESMSPAEQTKMAVDIFMQFTTHMLSDRSRAINQAWEDQMHRLYGYAEGFEITGLDAYKGIPGIKESLISGYERGGIDGLKVEFVENAKNYTSMFDLGDETKIIMGKIYKYGKVPNYAMEG